MRNACAHNECSFAGKLTTLYTNITDTNTTTITKCVDELCNGNLRLEFCGGNCARTALETTSRQTPAWNDRRAAVISCRCHQEWALTAMAMGVIFCCGVQTHQCIYPEDGSGMFLWKSVNLWVHIVTYQKMIIKYSVIDIICCRSNYAIKRGYMFRPIIWSFSGHLGTWNQNYSCKCHAKLKLTIVIWFYRFLKMTI
jgi:hypothetical protein